MKSISKIFVHFHRYFSFKVMIGIICIKIFLGQDPDPDPVGSGFRVDPGSGFDVSGRIHTPDTNIPYLGQRRLLAWFLSYSVFWQLQWNRQKSIGTLSVLLKIPIYLKSVKKKNYSFDQANRSLEVIKHFISQNFTLSRKENGIHTSIKILYSI